MDVQAGPLIPSIAAGPTFASVAASAVSGGRHQQAIGRPGGGGGQGLGGVHDRRGSTGGNPRLDVPLVPRKRLDSKRKYDEDNVTEVEEEKPWQQGGNQRRRKVNYGTSGVMVAGGEAAPYEVFIGYTNPGSTEAIIKDVLLQCSESVPEEIKLPEPLQVLEVVCLTRPSTDGTPLRTKCWKVVVHNKF